MAADLTEVFYLFEMPKTVLPGLVLVHNHIRPTRRLNSRGFRAWLQADDDLSRIEVCDCGWAPELGQHFRVRMIAL